MPYGCRRSALLSQLIEDLLPNTSYAVPNQPAAPLTDFVVSGKVVDVQRGHGKKPGKRDTWSDDAR